MTEHELRVCYETVYRMISRERRMREAVLANSPLLKQKLAECDNALVALTVMKDELKPHATGPVQATLVDAPGGKKGGY
jgi:hypothetical protein